MYYDQFEIISKLTFFYYTFYVDAILNLFRFVYLIATGVIYNFGGEFILQLEMLDDVEQTKFSSIKH